MVRRGIAYLVSACMVCSLVLAADYPAQSGSVNDGAEMLSAETETALEQKLLDFEESTSIGIAVATVGTLQGEDPNRYAVVLGNRWQIGDPDKDTGVIVLLAAKERQLAVWFADGYDGAWARRTSQHIRDSVMVPLLKAGKPEQAVIKGVDTVISEVAVGGYVNKWTGSGGDADTVSQASPTSAPPVEEVREVRRPLDPLAAGRVLLTIFGPLALILLLVRWSLVRRKRHELQADIASQIEALTHKLEQLPGVEEKLRGGYPESMWGPALSAINASAIERLVYSDSQKSGISNGELSRLRDELRVANGRLEHVEQLLRRAEHARDNAPRLLRELPSRLEVARAALQNADVLPESRAQLAPLEVRLQELTAQLPAHDASFNWASFGDAVDKLATETGALREQASRDVQQVQQARERVPLMMEEAQQKLAHLRALNGGRYSDVDAYLTEMDHMLHGYSGYGHNHYSRMDPHDLVYLLNIVTNALSHAQHAEHTYVRHVESSRSGSFFGSGGGGSSSWGGGGGSSSGGSSFGGGGGGRGGGGSSGW